MRVIPLLSGKGQCCSHPAPCVRGNYATIRKGLICTSGSDACGTALDVGREYSIMARHKRRRSRPSRHISQQERFHTPFDELRTVLRQVGQAPPPAVTPSPTVPRPPAPVPAEVQARQERALFLAEMAGVKPLPPDPRGRVEKHRKPPPRGPDTSGDSRALADCRISSTGMGNSLCNIPMSIWRAWRPVWIRDWRSACTAGIMPCRDISTCTAIRSRKPRP